MRLFILLASLSAHADIRTCTQPSSPSPVVNCVNPGGSCDGSVPCCGQENFCVRNRCQNVPAQIYGSSGGAGQP